MKPLIPKNAKTRLEALEQTLDIKVRELREIEQFKQARRERGSPAWLRLMTERKTWTERQMIALDPKDENFRSQFDRLQAVRDEYSLLLGLLADPEKRVEKVDVEIKTLAEEVKRIKTGGETSGQY